MEDLSFDSEGCLFIEVPKDVFLHVIFKYLNCVDFSRMERTCRLMKKFVVETEFDVLVKVEKEKAAEKAPCPTEAWLKKYHNVNVILKVKTTKPVSSLIEFYSSIRPTRIHVDLAHFLGEVKDPMQFLEEHGSMIESLNMFGLPRKTKEEVLVKVFTFCKNLKDLKIGDCWIGEYPMIQIHSEKCFAPLIENKIKFRKLIMFGMLISDYHEYDTGMQLTDLLSNSDQTLEKLDVCFIQYPKDITKFVDEDFLRRFPKLQRVRMTHTKIEVFFQHHFQLVMFEGRLVDFQLKELVKSNGRRIEKLIIYDQYPKNLDGEQEEEEKKKRMKLTDVGIKELSKCKKLKDFRVRFPFEIGSYKSYLTRECLLDSLSHMLGGEEKCKNPKKLKKKVSEDKCRLRIECLDENEKLDSFLLWEKYMDLDIDEMMISEF